MARGVASRFTFDPGNDYPVWSPDGKQIMFGSDRAGVFNSGSHWFSLQETAMTSTQYDYVTSVFFALIGAGHLWRVVAGWPVVIGAQSVPMWPSWVAVVVAGSLAWEGCRIVRRHAVGS